MTIVTHFKIILLMTNYSINTIYKFIKYCTKVTALPQHISLSSDYAGHIWCLLKLS